LRWALGVQSVGRDAAVPLDKDDRHRTVDGSYVDAPTQVTLQFEGLSFDDRAEFLDILTVNYNEANSSLSGIHRTPLLAPQGEAITSWLPHLSLYPPALLAQILLYKHSRLRPPTLRRAGSGLLGQAPVEPAAHQPYMTPAFG